MSEISIIGDGIAGLIVGLYTGGRVYGKNFGGQLSGMQKGPRILEYDKDAVDLLSDLGVKEEPREFKIGYCYSHGKKRSFSSSCDSVERMNYFRKSRGDDAQFDQSIMSDGKSTITGWDLQTLDLPGKMCTKVDYTLGELKAADFESNEMLLSTVHGDKVVPLSDSISTINLRTLLRLVETVPEELFFLQKNLSGSIIKSNFHPKDLDLSAEDTVFTLVVDNSAYTLCPIGFDYVYYTGKDDPINRVTRISSDQYCIECRGDKVQQMTEWLEKKSFYYCQQEVVRFCQLHRSYKLLEIGQDRPELYGNRIRLCGRFAQWDHDIKINDVIRSAKEYVEQMGN